MQKLMEPLDRDAQLMQHGDVVVLRSGCKELEQLTIERYSGVVAQVLQSGVCMLWARATDHDLATHAFDHREQRGHVVLRAGLGGMNGLHDLREQVE